MAVYFYPGEFLYTLIWWQAGPGPRRPRELLASFLIVSPIHLKRPRKRLDDFTQAASSLPAIPGRMPIVNTGVAVTVSIQPFAVIGGPVAGQGPFCNNFQKGRRSLWLWGQRTTPDRPCPDVRPSAREEPARSGQWVASRRILDIIFYLSRSSFLIYSNAFISNATLA